MAIEKLSHSRSISVGYVRVSHMHKLHGNRDIVESHIKSLMKAFDTNLVGVFVLSKRPNGTYYILDGQHRHEILLRLGRMADAFPSEIHEGLTREEELELCRAFNNNRRAWTAVDKFKLDLELRHPVALEIQSIVHRHGFKLNFSDGKRTDGAISSIGALRKIHERYPEGMLDEVLTVLAGAFGTREGFTGTVLLGIASFVSAYRNHPNYGTKTVIEKLKTFTPSGLEADGKQTKKLLGYSAPEGVTFQLLKAYNHRKTSGRLPEWSEMQNRPGTH